MQACQPITHFHILKQKKKETEARVLNLLCQINHQACCMQEIHYVHILDQMSIITMRMI